MMRIITILAFILATGIAIKAKEGSPKEYSGEWLYNMRHGNGICTYWNNDVYEGEWKENLWHGNGRLAFGNGDIYNGEFRWGSITGNGIFTYKNGEVYNGHIFNGNYQGDGVFNYKSGDIYTGEWVDGIKSGQGKMQYSNGDIYNGFWFEGKYESFGILEKANGLKYEGEWFAGTYQGQGKLIETSGEIYEGTFDKGKLNGEGSWHNNNGSSYSGSWVKNKYEGYGRLELNTGEVYEGMFRNGKYNGKGTQILADGTQITGTFKNGKAEGVCKSDSPDGDHYEGEFNNGKYEGDGKLWLKNGDYYKGIFKNGKMNKYGSYFYADGRVYEGQMWNDKRYGRGTLYSSNGSVIESGMYGKKGNLIMTDEQLVAAGNAKEELLNSMQQAQQSYLAYQKQQKEFQKELAEQRAANDRAMNEYSKTANQRSKYMNDVLTGKAVYNENEYINTTNPNNKEINSTISNQKTSPNPNPSPSPNPSTASRIIKPKKESIPPPKYKAGDVVPVVYFYQPMRTTYNAKIKVVSVEKYDFNKEVFFRYRIDKGPSKRVRLDDGYQYNYTIEGVATAKEGMKGITIEATFNGHSLHEAWTYLSDEGFLSTYQGNDSGKKIKWDYWNNRLIDVHFTVYENSKTVRYTLSIDKNGKPDGCEKYPNFYGDPHLHEKYNLEDGINKIANFFPEYLSPESFKRKTNY